MSVRLSVCLSSVCNVCIVAKRYVLSKTCLKKQIGLPDRYSPVPVRTPYDSSFPQTGVLTAPPNTCIANWGQTGSVSDMVRPIRTYQRIVQPSNGTIADLRTPALPTQGSRPSPPKKFAWQVFRGVAGRLLAQMYKSYKLYFPIYYHRSSHYIVAVLPIVLSCVAVLFVILSYFMSPSLRSVCDCDKRILYCTLYRNLCK